MNKILWITFNSFLDTDIYIVPLLAKKYRLKWVIIKNESKELEFQKDINKLTGVHNLDIEILVIGDRERERKSLFSYYRFFSSVKYEKIDIIYTCLLASPYFMSLLAINFPLKKIVLGVHNVHVPSGGSHYYFNIVNARVAFTIFKNFHTFSESQFNLLKKLKPNKNILYAPFLLKDYGKPNRKRKKNIITFLNFGIIRPYKRIDVLIEAAQKTYNTTRVPFRVIIAGQCDDWDKYQKLIKIPELFDIRLGRVENKEIPNLFVEADYFVAPYQDVAQSGSVVVSLNYLKPVIVSDLPAFTEYVEDGKNGFLVKPADIDDLFYIMVKVIKSHEEIYPKLCEGQRNVVKTKFSAESIKQKYEDFFNGIICK